MDLEMIVFSIISNAGDASAKFLSAVKEAENGNFQEAESLMKIGSEDLLKAHKVQTEMIQNELRGEKTEMSLIMVHAQDHLMNAMLLKDLANSLIKLHIKIDEK